MATAGRADLPALPTKTDLETWRASLSENPLATKFLRERGIGEACQQEFEIGLCNGLVTVPIYGPTDDGKDSQLLGIKSFEVDHEEISTFKGEGKIHAFPYPLFDAWDLDNPLVVTSDELSAAALTGIGQNAICTTVKIGKSDKLEFFPVGRFKAVSHFIVALSGNSAGRRMGKKLAFECKRAFPGARVTLVMLTVQMLTVGRLLGGSSDPAADWHKTVSKGTDEEISDDDGATIFESSGRLWLSSRNDSPECVAEFTGRLIEQGRTVKAGVDEGRHWVFELTHHLGHTILVEHRPENQFYADVTNVAGAEFTFEKMHGDRIRNYLMRRTGFEYETKHRGWQFGFTKTNFDEFLSPELVFKIGKSTPEPNDTFEMEAPHDSVDFCLPEPCGKEVDGLKLIWGDVLSMHHHKVTMPLLAATILAPVRRLLAIGHDPFLVFIQGQTGCGKTTRAKVFQSFFGDFWDSQKILTFKHTVFWIENLAAMAGDAPLLMDDLNYDKMSDDDAKNIRRYLQGTAQGGSRQRLTKAFGVGDQTPTEYCTKLITCEILPSGDQSLIARSMVVDVPHIDALSSKWRKPHDRIKTHRHLLPHAMTAWITWVMASPDRARERFDEIESEAKEQMKELFDYELGEGWGARRANFVRAFSRMSLFTAAFKIFAEWSRERGAIKGAEYDDLIKKWDTSVVYDMLESQVGALGEEGVANEMQTVIESAVASGRARLRDQRSGLKADTDALPSAPSIGFLEPVVDGMLRDSDFADNFALLNGRKVIVGLHQGVAQLWPSNSKPKMNWTRIKSYLEKADEVIYKKTRDRRYLLCKKELATRIVSCLGATDLAQLEETEPEVDW